MSDPDWHEMQPGPGDIKQLEAEIERLQKQCEGLAQAAMNNGQDLLLKEAEIERLRLELDLERRRLATSEDLRTGLARALERRKG